MAITLNIEYLSNKKPQYDLLIYQKPAENAYNHPVIAWNVISFKMTGDSVAVYYDNNVTVSFFNLGNFSPQMPVDFGQFYNIYQQEPGTHPRLTQGDRAVNAGEIHFHNTLMQGALVLYCYRSGRVVSRRHNIIPRQEAIFSFKPAIYMATVPAGEVEEGEPLPRHIRELPYTKIFLMGVHHAAAKLRDNEIEELVIDVTTFNK